MPYETVAGSTPVPPDSLLAYTANANRRTSMASSALQSMISACHAAGVRIYADVVFNQMSADSGTGVGGSSFNIYFKPTASGTYTFQLGDAALMYTNIKN